MITFTFEEEISKKIEEIYLESQESIGWNIGYWLFSQQFMVNEIKKTHKFNI